MAEIINELIYCERMKKQGYVGFELRGGQIFYNIACEYIDKEKNIGRCSLTKVLCDVILESEQWTSFVNSVCSLNKITLPQL